VNPFLTFPAHANCAPTTHPVFSLILLKNHKIALPNLKYKIKKYYLNKKNFYVKTLGAAGGTK